MIHGIQDYLRPRQALLLLDNFEHLLDAAPMIAGILAECPLIKVLTTSRTPLRLRAEHRIDVAPMRVPTDRAWSVDELATLPAIALFTQRARAVTAAELMTTPPVTIGPDEPVTQGVRLMYSRRVKRLPVTSDDGTLIGIVSRADVLSVCSRPDADIQREIIQNLILGKFGCDPARFTVTVTDGIVTIEGAPETDLAGRDIIDAARHVEGVVAVRDRLSYPQDTPTAPEYPAHDSGDSKGRQ